VRWLVLGARPFSFQRDDGSGKQEGTTVYYVSPEDQESGDDMLGLFPFQANGLPSLIHQFSSLPGEYEVKVGRRPGAKGKAAEVVIAVEFVRDLPLGGLHVHPSGELTT
jgi:hypothetical protein